MGQPVIMIPIPSPFCNEKWNYNTHGLDWNCKCSEGLAQSPIDLPDPQWLTVVENNANFDYKIVKGGKLILKENMLSLQGEFGYLLHATVEKGLYGLERTEVVNYNATEIIFKTPSDHTMNGKSYPLEIQIIHKATSKGDLRKRAVLSFLVQQEAGVQNKFIQALNVMDLPSVYNREAELTDKIDLIDLMASPLEPGIFRPFSYFTYTGSIPQPPCEEETLWIIKKDPILASYTALDLLRDVFNPPALGDNGAGCSGGGMTINLQYQVNPEGNNRQVQPLKGRHVYYYDASACEPTITPPTVKNGHYEKIVQDMSSYIYVEGDKPSGIPNAFVVDTMEAKGLKDDKETMRKKMEDYAKNFMAQGNQD